MNVRNPKILVLLGIILCIAACQSDVAKSPQTMPAIGSPGPLGSQTPTSLTPALPVISSPVPTPFSSAVDLNAFAVAFSTDGSSLAFNSSIDGLVPSDQNHAIDAFIYQTDSQAIQRIYTEEEQPGTIGSSQAESLSAGGRYLLFRVESIGWQPNPITYRSFYLRNLETGQDERMDFSPLEKKLSANNLQAVLSPDGRYLALEVYSSGWGIYLLDRTAGALTPVSVSPGRKGGSATSLGPAFSPDGRYLAFVSDRDNLVEGDAPCSEANPACGDVFLYEIASGKLERIPAHIRFVAGNPNPYLTLSTNARWLAWTEVETTLPHDKPVIRLYDRSTGKTETVCAGAGLFCSGHSPSLSANGRWLAFSTLPEWDASGRRLPGSFAQVVLLDRQTGQVSLLSADGQGNPGDGDSGMISLQSEGFSSDVRISGDGRFVAFSSQAANLLPSGAARRQCNAPAITGVYPCYDLFLYDRQTNALDWISHPAK